MPKIFKDTNNPAEAIRRLKKEKKAARMSLLNLAKLRYRKKYGKEYDTMDKTITPQDIKNFNKFHGEIISQ